MSFRTLDAGEILQTLDRLHQRIEERFPGSGLGKVAWELRSIGRECAAGAVLLARPNWPLRLGTAAFGLISLAGIVWGLVRASQVIDTGQGIGIDDYFSAVESVINDVVFLGIGVWFLASIEGRVKRQAALRQLHGLRSVAHVVDMHQLTKDPDRLLAPTTDTASSPVRRMSRADLGRYLDYCSELLSVSGKLAALFVQHFQDPAVMQSVNEIEDLTSGLSRKIWQKITLLERVGGSQT
jgi:hypothetical protein